MKLKQALEAIGLSKIEVDAYLTLLKTAGAQPASILANRMGINRTTAYKALINLSKLGLATKTMKHGIICFFTEDPEDTLKSLVEEKRTILKEVNTTILAALPSLIVGEEGSLHLPKIRYYEGVDGIKQVYEAVLKEGVDYYRYGDITKIYGTLGDFVEDYIKRRNKMGITAHAIMPYHKRSEELYKKDSEELRKALYIPYDLFPIEGEVRIFGNKVAILSLKQDSPISVIIESEVVARMFKSIFMLTWGDYTKRTFKL
ncbi:MAG: helix-turn-helix domain-containing protein [Patescibacteria group bacterium]